MLLKRRFCCLFAGMALAIAVRSLPAQDAGGSADVPQRESNQERQRQDDVAKLAMAKARRLDVSAGKDHSVHAELHKEPILRWSNPTIGTIYGEVFVWTIKQRPVALASIYRWYHPYRTSTVELVSVSDSPVGAKEGEIVHWDCELSGVTFASVPGTPAPAASREGRLVQMRSLARDFSASLQDVRGGEKVVRDLRLLQQPLHRYESPESGVLDGAIFAFVEGTDPEAWLVLEAAVGKDTAKAAWRFATARMNIDEMDVRYKSAIAQRWASARDAWMNPRTSYTLFNFDPTLVKIEESHRSP